MLLRLILIAFGFYLVIKLLGIIIRSVKAYKFGSVPPRKPHGEVGEGWIVDENEDKKDEPDKS